MSRGISIEWQRREERQVAKTNAAFAGLRLLKSGKITSSHPRSKEL